MSLISLNNSGGPRTAFGKNRSRWNSRKLGLFSRILVLSPEEQPTFNALKSALRAEFRPTSPMLEFLFDDLVVRAWRMAQADRFLQAEATKKFGPQNEENSHAAAGEIPPAKYPYPLAASEIRPRIKFLEELAAVIAQGNGIPQSTEAQVSQMFGADFWKLLTEWQPGTPVDLLLLNLYKMGEEKSRIYRMDIFSEPPATPEEERSFLEADYVARRQMVAKLVDQTKQQLTLDLHRANGLDREYSQKANDRIELAMRYQTTNRRDFYKALQTYREEQKNATVNT